MNKRETGVLGFFARALGALGLWVLLWLAPTPVLAQLSQSQTVSASITSGASIVLPSWTPAPNDLILVAVALRDGTRSVSVSGNGLTFVEIANLDNAQAQTGVNLFRAMGAAPSSGSITVTIAGNTLPAIASATRFAGVDASGTHGSGAVEAVATNAGPPATDDRNMKIDIATLTGNARAYAAGTHRLASFTVPPGGTAISINNVAGSSGDMTTLSTWYEAVPTAGTVTLGADNDLNSARDWAVIAVAIKAAGVGNTAPTVSLTSPANNATFTAPATIELTADAQDPGGTVAQVEFYQGAVLVATDTTAPFTFTLTNVAAGSYTFTARATDNVGAQTASAEVNIVVRIAEVFFIHTDHLDTPRAIANQANQLVWRWQPFEPFGANPPDENPSGLGTFEFNLRMPGQYFDKETNLHYNYFRDYDPATGRYPQSDPIGLQGGINTYAYVGNSPIASADPSGLACVSVGGRTTCSVPGGPTFTVPAPLGFPAMLAPNDDFYHFYRVQRSLGCAPPNSVLGGLINNPTPGVPLPATPQGTPNNAVVLGVNNYVTSYLTVDVTSGNPIVVNIAGTGTGAAFGPGYVARYVSGGQAYTSGEGLNWRQSPAVTGSAFQTLVNEALWGQQMNKIISQCGCQR